MLVHGQTVNFGTILFFISYRKVAPTVNHDGLSADCNSAANSKSHTPRPRVFLRSPTAQAVKCRARLCHPLSHYLGADPCCPSPGNCHAPEPVAGKANNFRGRWVDWTTFNLLATLQVHYCLPPPKHHSLKTFVCLEIPIFKAQGPTQGKGLPLH